MVRCNPGDIVRSVAEESSDGEYYEDSEDDEGGQAIPDRYAYAPKQVLFGRDAPVMQPKVEDKEPLSRSRQMGEQILGELKNCDVAQILLQDGKKTQWHAI